MAAPNLNLSLPHSWKAEILAARPLILPKRNFVYPRQAEEVEQGALEILVDPLRPEVQPFLATCALGFRDPSVPTGIWSAPHPDWLCAVAGGYAYLIDTTAPEDFTMIPYRPAMQILPAHTEGQSDARCLLFVGHHSILAWGEDGQMWESNRLSDEGVTISQVHSGVLHGMGWQMRSDKEYAFRLDLCTGQLLP